ncbi:MAG: hypothetical protein HYU71_08170 [Bacteroidetes bacterium]|nr:hypothetical protein [Bacteroidota bacterium]
MGNYFCGFEIRGKNRLKQPRRPYLKAKLCCFFTCRPRKEGFSGVKAVKPEWSFRAVFPKAWAELERFLEKKISAGFYPALMG